MSQPSTRIPFQIEINRVIELLAKQIYQDSLALLRENTQNAYDAILLKKHKVTDYEPKIEITISPQEMVISDNGIGMTKSDLTNHYWRAGSSGKNNPEARAAGVVGTFGIGAMANFGVASELEVVSEKYGTTERTRCRAERETLSASHDCIDLFEEVPTGMSGTTVKVKTAPGRSFNVSEATQYISQFVAHLDVPVLINGKSVSGRSLETAVPKPAVAWQNEEKARKIGPSLVADTNMVVDHNGIVWVALSEVLFNGTKVVGSVFLRQEQHQIKTFRSLFGLAPAAVHSAYRFGGVANLQCLQPTAGREALTTESLQMLQSIVTEIDAYVSHSLGQLPQSNSNTYFMEWAANNGRFDLCASLKIRVEPDNQELLLSEIRTRSQVKPFNYYAGQDQGIISSYATDDSPLLVLATRNPRQRCELGFLQKFCKASQVSNNPHVLSRKDKSSLSMEESGFAFRLVQILEADYFVSANLAFGKISHGLPLLVNVQSSPPEIVIDSGSSSILPILALYHSDYGSFSGMVKDFVRNVIFPKIAPLVPSSTRQGAEAFLKAIRRPKDIFEYEAADLRSLSEIWEDYLAGKLTLSQAAQRSATTVQFNHQVVDRSQVRSITDVVPGVVENQQILNVTEAAAKVDEFSPLPAITRLERESDAKLIQIPDGTPPLNGYRYFIALTERARLERGDFFLQPHRTEVVWGGQRVLYIFQHHSGRFGLYYELQTSDLVSTSPGGKSFPTSTIALKNNIYIPIPADLADKFVPTSTGRKRFEVRFELLYPDSGDSPQQSKPS